MKSQIAVRNGTTNKICMYHNSIYQSAITFNLCIHTNLMACNGPKSRLGLTLLPQQKVSPASTQKMTQMPKRMAVSSKQRDKSTSSWQLVLAAGIR